MSYGIKKVLVIGLGLIGGSLAKALKEKNFAECVAAFDRDPEELQQGLDLGVIDQACLTLEEGVKDASLVVLAVPVKATKAVLSTIAPHLEPGVVLTDVGSTKGNVVEAAVDVFGAVPNWFVPGHPIAGSEKSGVAAASAVLFLKHKIILTPLADSDPSAVQLIARMWQITGAEVLQMDIDRHDEVLAATSHLPHILAFSLVDTLASEEERRDIFRYAAGGFRDFTRIAASDPTMWHDVCMANKQEILHQIDTFTAGLSELRSAIDEEDSQAMLGVFTRAKAAREHFSRMLSGTAYSQKDNKQQVRFHIRKSGALSGRIRVPGDKSISHRAIILGAISDGITHIHGFLESEDSLATVQAFRDMGVVIEGPHQGRVTVYGVGLHGLRKPPGPLYLGNSGTSMRLLCGLLAAQPFDVELQGDKSLSQRPMNRIAEPLSQMGADVETTEGKSPIKIRGGQTLNGLHYQMPVASAQVKSGVLLAGLYAQQATTVTELAVTRDHTEKMLANFGADIHCENGKISIKPGTKLASVNVDIPADISSAAFFIVCAALIPGSDLVIEQVGVNPTRSGVIRILKLMGADITLSNEQVMSGEPVADIRVKYTGLKGVEIPESLVSVSIDEFPVIFIAAALADGNTTLTGINELRFKESDRIEAMLQGLQKMGGRFSQTEEQVIITGGELTGASVNSFGDHRVAMALAIAGAVSNGDVQVEACNQVATSFPDFVEVAQKAGIRMHKEET